MAEFIFILPEWFELMFLTVCIGSLVCGLWVLGSSAGTGDTYQGDILISARRLLGICIFVMIISTTVNLVMRSVSMSGQPITAISSVLPIVLFRTHYGRVWMARITALIFLAVLFTVGGRYRSSRGLLLIMLGVAVVVSMTGSASGHAADLGDFSVRELMDWLHLLAASFWGGGLIVLATAVLPKLVTPDEHAVPLLAGVARRFSRMSGIAVGIIAVTAVNNYVVYVGSFEALWLSPYGLTVVAKIILFFILVNLGAFNRYVNLPLLQECVGASAGYRKPVTSLALRLFPGLQLGGSGYRIAVRFMRSVRAEAALIACVLLCAAMLRHGIPARHAVHMGHGASTHSGADDSMDKHIDHHDH